MSDGGISPWADDTAATVPMVQLLTPDGERVSDPEYALDFSAGQYRDFYRDLVLVRRFDREATSLQRQGELGIWASTLGQEAAQVGAARAMRADDFAFPTYRDHGVAWCRGVDPLDVIAHFRGVSPCSYPPEAHGLAPYSIVLGSQVLHAVGWAMGSALAADTAAAVAFFGDGACSQGDVNEAMVWASVYRAPIVFFCQNNQWGISTPASGQTPIPLYQRASGFGFPGVRVDGNDVLATYAVTRAALDRAHAGCGPTLVEAYTYRMGDHTTSDDSTRYRAASELDRWQRLDPVDRMRALLVRGQLADSAFFQALDDEADMIAERVRSGCRSMPDPDPLTMFDHVFAEQTPLLRQQRGTLAEYLADFPVEGGPA